MLMNLFKRTAANPSKTVNIGGALSGKKLVIDENFITYKATDGRFKVKKSAIDTKGWAGHGAADRKGNGPSIRLSCRLAGLKKCKN